MRMVDYIGILDVWLFKMSCLALLKLAKLFKCFDKFSGEKKTNIENKLDNAN